MIEITFKRAFKIWWSLGWRFAVMQIGLMPIVVPLMFWVTPPFPKPGEPYNPPVPDASYFGKFFVIWVFMVIGTIFLHTIAIQWFMRTKWSDFKLKAVPLSDPE